jgi:NmrA-like family
MFVNTATCISYFGLSTQIRCQESLRSVENLSQNFGRQGYASKAFQQSTEDGEDGKTITYSNPMYSPTPVCWEMRSSRCYKEVVLVHDLLLESHQRLLPTCWHILCLSICSSSIYSYLPCPRNSLLYSMPPARSESQSYQLSYLSLAGVYEVCLATPTASPLKSFFARGLEVVKANVDDPASLGPAVEGSYAVFAVTDFWEPVRKSANKSKVKPRQTVNEWGYHNKMQQAKNIVDHVANITSLKRLIWSGLSSVKK